MRFHGSCHCGNISFTYEVPGADDMLQARICNCSFCQKHGGIYTSQAGGGLNATFAEEQAVMRYRFGTKTADYYICSRCGILPFVTCEIDGTLFGIVNINSLDDLRPEQISPLPVDFDGETVESRIARRKRNWASQVTITAR